jgi:hypothetical protein
MIVLWALLPISIAAEEFRSDHVAVSYTAISEDYARAISRTVEAARAVAIEKFGFDMPGTIVVNVNVNPNGSVELFNDGQDRFSLTVRSEKDLRKPAATGTFHLYGLCHEVGHLAMYRPIRDHSWMTSAAAEGWAHYLGSRIVDEVYAGEGPDLWPDRYDYLADGMKRLEKQLAAANPGSSAKGAGLWKELVEIVGDQGIAPIFAAWGKAEVDSAEPGKTIGQLLANVATAPRAKDWWSRAEETLIFKRPRSELATQTVTLDKLAGPPKELAHDDGRKKDHKSIAGGGHAVRFEAPGDAWYLTSVRIHGMRYGQPAPPREDFHVWLCDENLKQIADFAFPYKMFARGKEQWVMLRVKPTAVPPRFIICAGFNPTGTKGVFLSYAGPGTGNSLIGLPGGRSSSFEQDWMIRATVMEAAEKAAADATAKTSDPAPSKLRTWTDASGSFTVEAELVEVAEGNVRLRMADGSLVTVPLAKLSEADREHVGSLSEGPAEPAPSTVYVTQLAGKSRELKQDDGVRADHKSFPMGHAVAFDAPGDSYYLTSVRVHGSRYGYPQAPREDFHVSLCDENFNLIADFPFPYSKFQRGAPTWVTLRTRPTKVPPKFVICVNFNPTGTKGVFVSHDAEGKALVGLPGKPAGQFTGGDWLIRATVDQWKGNP